MKRDKLTDVERRFAEVAHSKREMRELPNDPEQMRELREYMREIAYHEAGHITAEVFAREGDGWTSGASRTTGASIIPDSDSMGRATVAQGGNVGYAFLLDILAGRAINKQMSSKPERKAIIDPKCGDWNQEEADLCRARMAAEVMARPNMSAMRILATAEKWTVEMLALPDVWHTVERLADMLLKCGTLEADAILAACAAMKPARNRPKWRRRLMLTITEPKVMGLPTGPLPKWKG